MSGTRRHGQVGMALPALLAGLLSAGLAAQDATDAAPATAVADATAASGAFHLTNDVPYDRAFTWLIANPPQPWYAPEQDYRWLEAVVSAADLDRHGDVALAAAERIVARWPQIRGGHLELARMLGKQGRFREALATLDALAIPDGEAALADRIEAAGQRARWRWQAGERDPDAVALPVVPPGINPGIEREVLPRWAACQAYFVATCGGDAAAVRTAVLASLQHRDREWLHYLRRDSAFDALRDQDWFIQAVGATAVGHADGPAFAEAAPCAQVAVIRGLPAHPEETAARTALADAQAHLERGELHAALSGAQAALKLAPLPEGWLVVARAAAGLGDITQVARALAAFNHADPAVDSPVCDVQAVVPFIYTRVTKDGPADLHQALECFIEADVRSLGGGGDQILSLTRAALDYRPEMAGVVPLFAMAQAGYGLGGGGPDKAGAAIRLRGHLTQHPDDAEAMYQLALIRTQQGHYEESQLLLVAALRLAPDDRRVAAAQCDNDFQQGHPGLAVARLLAMKPVPGNALGALIMAANEAEKTGDEANAIALLRMLQAAWPGRGYWREIADCLLRSNALADAEDANLRARFADGDGIYGGIDDLQRVAILARLGRMDEAKALMHESKTPSRPEREYSYAHAVAAACLGDEVMVQQDLATWIAQPDWQADQAAMLGGEILFAPWRGKPWFSDLLQQARVKDAAQSAQQGPLDDDEATASGAANVR